MVYELLLYLEFEPTKNNLHVECVPCLTIRNGGSNQYMKERDRRKPTRRKLNRKLQDWAGLGARGLGQTGSWTGLKINGSSRRRIESGWRTRGSRLKEIIAQHVKSHYLERKPLPNDVVLAHSPLTSKFSYHIFQGPSLYCPIFAFQSLPFKTFSWCSFLKLLE